MNNIICAYYQDGTSCNLNNIEYSSYVELNLLGGSKNTNKKFFCIL